MRGFFQSTRTVKNLWVTLSIRLTRPRGGCCRANCLNNRHIKAYNIEELYQNEILAPRIYLTGLYLLLFSVQLLFKAVRLSLQIPKFYPDGHQCPPVLQLSHSNASWIPGKIFISMIVETAIVMPGLKKRMYRNKKHVKTYLFTISQSFLGIENGEQVQEWFKKRGKKILGVIRTHQWKLLTQEKGLQQI